MLFASEPNSERVSLNWFTKQILNIIKYGSVPKHIGFIMDGNRRFAKKLKLQTIQGHAMGAEKMLKILGWCRYLDISNITIYLFSIENFNRTKEEVEGLMKLAVMKYKEILKDIDNFNRNGYCVRTIGNFSLIPDYLKKLMAEVYLKTQHNSSFLNVAFAYTSRDEICRTMQLISSAKVSEEIFEEDIDIHLFNNLLFHPKLDLLVRTSGEVRLSDFMLWQSSNTHIEFINVMWPELSIWHIIYCILKYQRYSADVNENYHKQAEKSEKIKSILEKYNASNLNYPTQ